MQYVLFALCLVGWFVAFNWLAPYVHNRFLFSAMGSSFSLFWLIWVIGAIIIYKLVLGGK